MKEELDHIIKHKNYRDLTGDELRLLEKEGISKDDFIALKLFFQQMEIDKTERLEKLAPVKSKLDDLFEAKHKKGGLILWRIDKAFYAQPLLQIAATIVLIVLFYNNISLKQEPTLAMNQEVVENKNSDARSAKSTKKLDLQEEMSAKDESLLKDVETEGNQEIVEENAPSETKDEKLVVTGMDAFASVKAAEDTPVKEEEVLMNFDEIAAPSLQKALEEPALSAYSEVDATSIVTFNSSTDASVPKIIRDSTPVALYSVSSREVMAKSYKKEKEVMEVVNLEEKQDEFAILTPLF
ncbi:hypothetical protein SAMN05216474_1231 [Lishizhenia tianjinensis]|uniref:Uncharacterized protein n=1 Tax=Lishizhenia tianjinensis TaxID=477690 RepID=A0A1I6YWC7_9FLAO|nr:hypothetical protein [Lishizhenia tianjinensis]SFT54664.1 hypothetical protein SAMN05216474_1231 [Lishizhenia tianjinensis]